MKKILLSLAAITVLLTNVANAKSTLVKNIKGYSINNGKLITFTALKFTNDKIDQLYFTNDSLPQDSNLTIVDGQNQTMLPGLIDAHGHILGYGQGLQRADLTGTVSEKEAALKTQKYANENPNVAWVLGRGWNQVQWPTNEFPTAASLDKVFPDKPVWLRRVDGHAGWANTKAMALAGINNATKAPVGGEIIRLESGQPSGVFIDNAMDLIESAITPLSDAENKQALIKALDKLASMGLTSVHDAGITQKNLALYRELNKENKMAIRVNAMLYLPTQNWQQVLQNGHIRTDNDMLLFNSVKIQADGALGSRGAALINDYSDKHGHRGLLLHSKDDFKNYVLTAMEHGFQVNSHAIGDHANQLVLDEYENLIEQTNTKPLRHRIEHAQILRLSDIPRFSQLGIIASMQATHATSDKNMAQTRLGPKRILGAYAWRKLLNENTIIAAGSDFPVESPNPFYGLHASVTRQDHQNMPKTGWFNEEAMTIKEALKSFTIDAAYAGHQESLIGSLEQGKKADFILLDNDIFQQSSESIWRNKVNQTWVNGRQVFKR